MNSKDSESYAFPLTRRRFLSTLGVGAAASRAIFFPEPLTAEPPKPAFSSLPNGAAQKALTFDHFPDRLHAFVWRNWPLVPLDRIAKVVNARPSDIANLAKSMGLGKQPDISHDLQQRSYITVIRRNWHLLDYPQLLDLLGWTIEKLDFTLREDDFLFVKLGNLKPACEPLLYSPPTEIAKKRASEIAELVARYFSSSQNTAEPLFAFVKQLSAPPERLPSEPTASQFSPRFCYSYFALYGDPLLTQEIDPYPDGYLQRLATSGVNGVWLQGVLENLAPAPWSIDQKEYKQRLQNLVKLVARARKHGIGIYLYLNEPRSKPLSFFAEHLELKGVVEGGYAALCTSSPQVQSYMRDAITAICKAVPDLAGFFTISGSENLSNCWSHQSGAGCPRCSKRPPAQVISELNNLIATGIRDSGTGAKLIAWDWGWPDAWAPGIIEQLAPEISLMSVSEWSLPIERGGVKTTVGEYSLSAIGPGPRATRHWELARKRGLKTIAKIQAGNTWELSAIPYIPVLLNVAEHAAHLRDAKVDGLMLGWTLGGYPSPNMEIVAEIGANEKLTPTEALQKLALKRFGLKLGRSVVSAWNSFSLAFREFPFDGSVVYNAPMQFGSSNLLWIKPTGYRATMIGFPYDDLNAWRGGYPAETFVQQFNKVADGFARGIEILKTALRESPQQTSEHYHEAASELILAEAAYIHFASVAAQSRFLQARNRFLDAPNPSTSASFKNEMLKEIEIEKELAIRLYQLQSKDSRIGYEASNHYYYVLVDLMEKVLNCESLKNYLAALG